MRLPETTSVFPKPGAVQPGSRFAPLKSGYSQDDATSMDLLLKLANAFAAIPFSQARFVSLTVLNDLPDFGCIYPRRRWILARRYNSASR
jgi:hypothetical protein